MSFIEILVAVVLTGLAVVATLAALRASTVASRIDREQAKTQSWLQSATDYLYAHGRVPCDSALIPPQSFAITHYTDHIQLDVDKPDGWTGGLIEVTEVLMWNELPAAGWSATECQESLGHTPQLITIEATSPTGDARESVQVVLGA